MRIQHNIAALNSYRQLGTNNNAVSKNLEKLSSGYRINRAGDDAAGLAISEKMRAQITGLETAQKNALDGISLVQTAEGALTEVHSMLNRMTELATQSANGTYSSEVDRENLQKEVATLKDEIDRISKSTNFNGIKLLDGSLGDASGILSNNQADPVAGVELGFDITMGATNGTINVGSDKVADIENFVTGELIEGKNEVNAKSEFYITDKISATATGTNAGDQKSSSFEIEIGGSTVKIELKSDTAGAGDKTELDISDLEEIFSQIAAHTAGGTQVTVTAGSTDNFGITSLSGIAEVNITITSTPVSNTGAGAVNNFKDLSDKYDFSFSKNGSSAKSGTLVITASSGHADAAKGSEFVIGEIKNFTTANAKDSEDILNIIKEEFGDVGNTTTLGFGWQNEAAKVVGSDKIDHQYKMSSVDIKLEPSKLHLLHNKSLVIDGITYIFNDKSNSNGLEASTPADGSTITGADGKTTTVKHITFDSTVDQNDANHIGNKLASAIHENSATVVGNINDPATGTYAKELNAYFDKATNTIKIQESVQHAEAVLDKAGTSVSDAKDMVNDLSMSSHDKELGAYVNNHTQITIDNNLKADVWIEVDGKRYQFAMKPDDVEEGSVFVQFTEGDEQKNAQALLDAIKNNSGTGSYANATISTNASGAYVIDFVDEAANLGETGFKGLSLQVGDTSDAYQKVTVRVEKMDTESLGIADVDISEIKGAEEAIGKLRDAINSVSSTRGDLGAVQNRLEHTINNLGVTTENITAAESRIRDTDMAEEMMAYTKNNILVQAAQAMLAQANTVPQGVLQLLG